MWRLTALVLISILPAGAHAQDEGAAAMLRRAAPAVVQVVGSNCTGGTPDRAGSGFLWDLPRRVVTALHVVSGCGRISVSYQGIDEKPATIERTLLVRDLALLTVQSAPNVPALSVATTLPPVSAAVWVYGYGGGRATREDRQLRVTDANRDTPLLRHAVDQSAREELQRLGSPLLDTEVLRLEGNLLPGDSGAPILDAQGRVVGVGSGGLQRGTIGAGWAVRARYVVELGDSTERSAGPAAGTASALYALVDPRLAAEAQCGAVRFRRTRTMRLEELVRTSDDPEGWKYLAAGVGRPLESFNDLRFDIWIEARSGGAIALPQGAVLRAEAGRCRAQLGGGEIDLQLAGMLLSGTALEPWQLVGEAGPPSAAFENAWGGEFLPWIMPNPKFTYPMPRQTGSAMVRRRAYWGQRPSRPWHFGFETLMATPDTFIGIAAVNRAYNPFGPQPPALLDPWIAATFAVHLSTVPR